MEVQKLSWADFRDAVIEDIKLAVLVEPVDHPPGPPLRILRWAATRCPGPSMLITSRAARLDFADSHYQTLSVIREFVDLLFHAIGYPDMLIRVVRAYEDSLSFPNR